MHSNRIHAKNLELLARELDAPLDEEDIGARVYYDDDDRWAVVHQTRGLRRSRVDVTKRSDDFSLTDILYGIPYRKIMEMPRDEGIEDALTSIDFEKTGEEDGHDVYRLNGGSLRERMKDFTPGEVKAQFRDYLRLWKEEPEYGLYETMNILSNTASGMLLGAVMPSFWDYGGMMQLAGTMIAIQKIGTPLTNVLSSGGMGRMVDRFNREADLESLKGLQKKVGALHTFLAADTFLMQKGFIAATPAPEAVLLSLYGIQTIGATAGRMALESKSHYSIRDYLIRKNPKLDEEDKERFYQLIGSGHALAHLGYAGAFAGSWLACRSNPALILPIAAVSGLGVVATKFAWAYTRRVRDPVSVDASDCIVRNGSYVFDTGWRVETDEPLVSRFRGYDIPGNEGALVTSDTPVRRKEGMRRCTLVNEAGRLRFDPREYACEPEGDRTYLLVRR